jgi:hypothetical protein
LADRPVADREITYGIRIWHAEPEKSACMDAFRASVKTDANGRFTLTQLVPGQTYHLNVTLDGRSSRDAGKVTPKDLAPVQLGDINVDPTPPGPSVPPTPTKQTASEKPSPPGVTSNESRSVARSLR